MKEWTVLRVRMIRPACLACGGVAAIGGAVLLGVAIVPTLVHPVASQPVLSPVLVSGTFKPTEAQFRNLTIVPVSLVTFRSESITEGSIAIDDDLNTPVYSPYSGRVVKLIVKLGDHVERGAPLFEVEATELVNVANNLITAVAASKTAKSQLSQAEINARRAYQLYLGHGEALKDWRQSQTDLAMAQDGLRSAEIALTEARNQLRILGKSEADIAALEAQPTQQLDAVTSVLAPIEGIVTQRQIASGQNIQSISNGASNPVYTVGDLSTVWLIANVPEDDAPMMHLGAPVEVRVPAYPGRVFNARISRVAVSPDPNTHRLPVRADVDNPDGALKPMMFGNFSILTGAGKASPGVPQSAIVYKGDTARIWLAHDDGTLEVRPVRVGRVQAGMAEILHGVSVGEKTVTSGALFIDRAASSD